MGNDGGSIPDRRDLVKTKAKAEQADKANQTRARWFFCALSKRPLQEPVVSCALGKLYNKDAILEYLINKSAYGDGDAVCGHIKSLKDVKTLKLTLNPAPTVGDGKSSGFDRAQFICPITMKEMNGSVPFVYIATCGCVLSRAGLKALAGTVNNKDKSPSPSSSDSDASKEKEGQPELEVCPQCATKYEKDLDVRTLNPDAETEEAMRLVMEARQRAAKAAKASSKSKKRKAVDSNGIVTSTDGASDGLKEKTSPAHDEGKDVSTKKARTGNSASRPSLNPSMSAMSTAVLSSLAQEEAKRKAGMSDAVRSLYEGRANTKETWMTRTFNRYA